MQFCRGNGIIKPVCAALGRLLRKRIDACTHI
jgi:hypothetical protein